MQLDRTEALEVVEALRCRRASLIVIQSEILEACEDKEVGHLMMSAHMERMDRVQRLRKKCLEFLNQKTADEQT